jgi:hypothetical protein
VCGSPVSQERLEKVMREALPRSLQKADSTASAWTTRNASAGTPAAYLSSTAGMGLVLTFNWKTSGRA